MKKLTLIVIFAVKLTLLSQADTGTVTGRVLDMNGLPAANVRVALASPNTEGKITADILSGFTVTDETGHYRIENIPPGRYAIVAGAVASPTFYPGTATPSGASLLNVERGSTTAELNFALVFAAPQPGRQSAANPSLQPRSGVQLSQVLTVTDQIIAGRIVIEGPVISSFLPLLKVTFFKADPLPNTFAAQGNGVGSVLNTSSSLSTEVKWDNTFRLALKSMPYRISVGRADNKPLTGFVVKSMTLGTINLLKQDLKTNTPVTSEIIITLQPVPSSNPIKL